MVSISELRKTISTRKTQAHSAQKKTEEAKRAIPKTTAQQLRSGRGLQGRQEQRGLASTRAEVEGKLGEIGKFQKETLKAEKKVEEYLRTPSGIVQYAKEKGIAPKTISGKLGRGYSVQVLGYEYTTPYGTYTDWSPKYKQLETERKLAGMASEEISKMGFTSPKEFERAIQEGKLTEKQIRRGGIDPKALQIQENIRAKVAGVEPGKVHVAELGTGLTILGARDFSKAGLAKRVAASRAVQNVTTTLPTVQTVKNFQLDSGDKSLSSVNGTKVDVGRNVTNSSVVTGMAVGVPAGSNNEKPSSSILSRISSYWKGGSEAGDEAQKIYVPETGGYVSSKQVFGEGLQQTAVTRPITQTEAVALKIDTTVPLTGNFITSAPSGAGYQAENLFLKGFETVFGGQTPREVEAIVLPNTLRDNTNVGVGKYPTIGQVARDITAYPGTVTREFFAPVAGEFAEKGTGKVIDITGYTGITTPETTVDITTPYFGTVQTDPITGKDMVFKIDEGTVVPERTRLKPETLVKGAGVIAQIGTYAAAEFIAPVATNVGFVSLGTQRVTQEGATSGEKLEGYFEIGGGLLGLGIFGGSKVIAKTKLTKAGKYFDVPESKIVRQQDDIFRNVMVDRSVVPKARLDQAGGEAWLSLTKKAKGKTVTTEILPTGTVTGRVVETRGAIEGSGFFTKTDDLLEEVIKFDDGITRITQVPKEGKATVRLLEGEKEIFKTRVEPGFINLDDLTPGKSNIEQIKIDKTSQSSIGRTQLDLSLDGKKASRTKLTTPEGDIAIGDDLFQPTSRRLTTDIEIKTTSARNVEKGVFKYGRETSGYLDVDVVGPRKALLQVEGPRGSALLRKQVPQKIVSGLDDSKDFITRSVGETTRTSKLISPARGKQTTEIVTGESTAIFLKPGTKSQKAILSTEKAKVVAAKKYAKEADFIRDIIDENIIVQDSFGKVGAGSVEAPTQFVSAGDDLVQVVRKPAPSYVGGKGGLGSESKYAFNPEDVAMLENLPTTTYVEPPKLKGLKGASTPEPVPLLGELTVIETTTTPVTGSIGLSKSLVIQDTKQDLKVKLKEETKLDTKIKLDFAPKLSDKVKEETKITQQFKQEFRQVLKQEFKQPQKFRERFKQTQKSTQKQPEPTKPKKIIVPIPLPGAVGRLIQRVKEQPETFEAVGFRFGKEVTVAKGTKKEVSKKLSKFLGGSLSASGFLQTSGGKKIKAEETGLLGEEFRVGKRSKFLVVEKKEKRLRKASTGKQIQSFRSKPNKSKKKKGKSLFGL